MKKYLKSVSKPSQTLIQTDLEDSCSVHGVKKVAEVRNKSRRWRRNSNKNRPEIYPIRILRFRLRYSGGTLRVPCYNEEQLSLPRRFTKKLNTAEVDNDIESDEEVVQHEVQRCCEWIKEAIKTRGLELNDQN